MSPALALFDLPVVVSVGERAANDRPFCGALNGPVVGEPISRPETLSLWHVFEALQDAADEEGATPREADALVMAAYFEIQSAVVPGRCDDES